MRLIDAEALINWLTKETGFKTNCEDCTDIDCLDCIVEYAIKNTPTIEAKPVVHAHWDEVSGGRIICTHCGNYPLYDYFGRLKLSGCCPSCGAIMDEK